MALPFTANRVGSNGLTEEDTRHDEYLRTKGESQSPLLSLVVFLGSVNKMTSS